MVDVIVIGGGPAGAASAIRLSQSGLRVRLYEKARFPRAKLCGGFLSSESIPEFGSLGILGDLQGAGAATIHRVQVSAPGGARAETRLSQPALSLSRDRLDAILLER